MKFLVKVRVNPETIREFGAALREGKLDRSGVRGETVCLSADPAVGYSIWETGSAEEFALKFASWKAFYSETEVREVISPAESMEKLFLLLK